MTLRACGQTRYRPAGQAKATYGIDGCAITLPVLASLQVGPAAMTVWALRRKRRSLGALAGAAWLAAAGVTGSYLYSTLRGKFQAANPPMDERTHSRRASPPGLVT